MGGHPTVRPRPPLPHHPPLHSAPRFLSAQRHPTVNVSPQSHNFPTSECRKTVEICRLTPFCPNPPKQLPYVQLHLQAWSLGVSRFILRLFGRRQLSKFLPLQAMHNLKSCCWTVGDSAPGAKSHVGLDTSRVIVA